MPRRTLPPAANRNQRTDEPRRRRIETNETTSAFIEDFPGLTVELVGATEVEDFTGSKEDWKTEQTRRRAHKDKPPIDTMKE